jgi:hypothetical protein
MPVQKACIAPIEFGFVLPDPHAGFGDAPTTRIATGTRVGGFVLHIRSLM